MTKFKLTSETKNVNGVLLRLIEALGGDSHIGANVFGDAMVCDNAKIIDGANAHVLGGAEHPGITRALDLHLHSDD